MPEKLSALDTVPDRDLVLVCPFKFPNQTFNFLSLQGRLPVSILYKSIVGRYRPVRVADGPITARYRFVKNASRELFFLLTNF